MKLYRLSIFFLPLIALVACTSAGSAPPRTASPVPTHTLTRDQALLQAAQLGTPIPEWRGIPVMAGVTKASLAGTSYTYLIPKSLDAVETFYHDRMLTAGWNLDDRDNEDTSAFGGPSVALDFSKGSQTVNIIMMVSTRDQATVVVINVVQ